MTTGKVTPLPEARFAPLPPTNQRQGERIDWDALTVLHTFDFRRPNLPPPLVWAPPSEVAS